MGFFWRLAAPLRGSLVSMARHELPARLKEGRVDKLSHDEEKLQRREEAVQRQLNATVDRYAAALELFDQWETQGVKDRLELDAVLAPMSPNEQVAELRRQIEMRTLGCGWTQFATKFTFFADEKEHTTEQLRGVLLEDILPHEIALRRKKKLPTAAAPPQTKVRMLKALGSDDADALRLEAKRASSTQTTCLPRLRRRVSFARRRASPTACRRCSLRRRRRSTLASSASGSRCAGRTRRTA